MEAGTSSKNMNLSKLKIAGAWSGVLEVELDVWTIPMVREEVAKRSNCEPESINLICGGKVLKDGGENEKLSALGLKNNAKILASRVYADQGKSLKEELMAEEERARRLARIKAAAIALSKRHAEGSLPVEDFNIEVEDQSGRKVHLGSETDQRGLMMGLMLHANAKQLIKRQKYKDALDVLSMGEEAFSLCDSKVLEMIDNVPILQVDMVWCYFMLRDITWLSMAGVRLVKAREGIERAHGKDSNRVRLLQAGRFPEVALSLRLELLEGIVAYHSGQFENSRKALTSAQAKYLQLQIPDEALSLLLSMGYKENMAKRALRMTNQDVQSAVEFLVEEKIKRQQRLEDDIRRRNEIREQKLFGITPLGKAVDLQRLNELVAIGFEKELAAEALRRNENDPDKALDDLTNPEINSSIQFYIESKKRKRQRQALHSSTNIPNSNPAITSNNDELSGNPVPGPANAGNGDEFSGIPMQDNSNLEGLSNEDIIGGSSSFNQMEDRDEEMEDEIAKQLTGDALSDYDIEVTKEGEAISEYLALLDSISSK